MGRKTVIIKSNVATLVISQYGCTFKSSSNFLYLWLKLKGNSEALNIFRGFSPCLLFSVFEQEGGEPVTFLFQLLKLIFN